MAMVKDLFSDQSKLYSLYRPSYPNALYQYILTFVAEKNTAWDCATGNGQAAVKLAQYFKQVKATDISAAQLKEAIHLPNIEYLLCPAEKTPFADDTFDLVTVAQAYHWFNHNLFAKEVYRTAKDNAVVAIWLYDRLKTGIEKIDALLDDFYWNITGPYWDSARKYIDDHYSTLPFPYEALPPKEFETNLSWSLQHLTGFLTSWSAVQHYIKVNGRSPLLLIEKELESLWEKEKERNITIPFYLKIGRIRK